MSRFTRILCAALVAVVFANGNYIQKSAVIMKEPSTNKEINSIDKLQQRNSLKVSSNAVQIREWRGPAAVLGGALVHLTLGTLYCWGNFISYSPLSLRYFDGSLERKGQPESLFVIPFTLIAQALAMPFGPALTKAIGAPATMLLGSWITALGVYLASFQTKLLPFLLFYSLIFGTGVGLSYTAPMIAGWKWMPDNRGLVSGGILTGFGVGGFIFSLLGSKIVNPQGLNMVEGRFPDEVYNNFPKMLRTLSGYS